MPTNTDNPPPPIIYLVDDDNDTLDYLSTLLSSLSYEVACYTSAEAFLAEYNPNQPAILISDVVMKDMSGLELQRILNARGSDIPIIMMSAHGNIPIAKQALKAGSIDFIEKPIDALQIIESVKEALNNYVHNQVVSREKEVVGARLECLTEREREILNMLLEGDSSKQVATALKLSPRTVETHRNNIMKKMHVHSFPELVRNLLTLNNH